MNKAQKQVQQVQLNDEKKIIKQLQRIYDQARKDCEQKIRELSSRTDLENLQTIIYQKQYQEALKKQLDGVLDNLNGQEFTSVADYLQKSYHNGYCGVMYDLAGQDIPITMPINQEQVVKALQTDSKLSNGLYSRLGEDVDYLKKSIRAELSRGVANGSTWNEIATHISKGMNNPFNKAINNAIRISRTEGHRIQQKSALDGQYAAKDKGAEVVKQWDSTLDNRVRPHHRQLDGQIRELEEPFEVNGMTADAPGHFGRAKEDCNCRCCLLQRAKWALDQDELDELKERAAYFGLDKADDFEDFKKNYLHLPDKADTMELKDIQLGELRSAYGKKHSTAIKKKMEDAPDEVKRVWNNCVGEFRCIDPKYRGDKAFYSPGYDGVKLNISKAAKGSGYQTPYQVVFHEYGHHTDYVLNRKYGNGDRKKAFSETYKNGIFGQTLKKEAITAIENFAKTVMNESTVTEDVQKAFCEQIKKELTLIQRADISDMFEPVMMKSCVYPFGVGHGTGYWKSRNNGKEGFAEMYSAMIANPESLEQIMRFFPKSVKIFQEMLGVME